ncbi:MAG: MBOAT family protein [Oscillospiraceae bacterium]|nr:MBOAT family protein [Oscillospiraceae bacterium]
MLFNSYIFIFVFFPLCLIGYFGLNHFKKYTLAQAFLLGMSLWFYGYFNPSYLAIILVSIVMNYGFTLLMGKTRHLLLRKLEVILAILGNISVLFYFKYFDFFLMNVNRIFHCDFTLRNILLPLGISFFTFQQVSYVVDAYRGEVQKYNFLQYASFVAYFPQLIAGPIVTHDELIPQFMDLEKKKFNWDNFAQGMFMFVLGLGKKVLIADVFGVAANWGFDNVQILDTTNAFLTSLAYTIQIYFDFSGYCDMAIGIGRMMNLELPVNFDSPYKALTIDEFWHRWHKTLTRFFTRYIYIPLGGSRRGAWRTYLNVMIVYLVSGIWHGANYTFIAWGILHGLFSVLYRWQKPRFDRFHPVFNWLLTFTFVNLAWVLFRADSIGDALVLFKALLRMEIGPVNSNITNAFLLPEITLLINKIPQLMYFQWYPNTILLLFYVGAMALVLGARNAREHMLTYKPGIVNLVATALLLFWCIMSFSGVSTFLYFNF